MCALFLLASGNRFTQIVSALLEEMKAFWKQQELALTATRTALREAHLYLDQKVI